MIYRFICLSATIVLTACATTPTTFDETFSQSEIAGMTADYFDLGAFSAERALKPTYKKYGAPHVYINGFMSAVAGETEQRLHGTGLTTAKLSTSKNVYWAVGGSDLPMQSRPLKTAHLIYNKVDIENLEDVLISLGSLSQRGQVFTVFERETDGQIVVTLNLSDDLGVAAELQTISFSPI